MDCIKVCLPEKAKVVVLEDSDMRITWFEKRIPDVVICRTVKELKDHFANNPSCDFMFWDHDLGTKDNGADAAKWFRDKYGSTNRYHVIHSFNRAGARNIQSFIPAAVHIPFGDFEVEFV